MGGDPRPFSISSLSRIYLPWFLEGGEYSYLSEMLSGVWMINVLCYVDVRAVLFSKWELFVTSALALSKLWLCPILWAD